MRTAPWLLLPVLLLAGCESNQERSAHLAKLARHRPAARSELTITRASTDVKVVGTTILRGAESAAAVVRVRNTSSHTLRNVPIAITVKNAAGRTLFQNNVPGLEAALTSLASLPAHSEATWVDDQVQTTGAPASVSAIVGEAPVASGSVPQIDVLGMHASEEGAGGDGAAGTVHNRSNVTQQSLVVYVLARRGDRIFAAGRAVLPEMAAGAAVPFQTFLVGTAKSAKLEASAPPTTLR